MLSPQNIPGLKGQTNVSCNHSSCSLFSCLSGASVEPDRRADSRKAAFAVLSAFLVNVLAEKNESSLTKVQRGEQAEGQKERGR